MTKSRVIGPYGSLMACSPDALPTVAHQNGSSNQVCVGYFIILAQHMEVCGDVFPSLKTFSNKMPNIVSIVHNKVICAISNNRSAINKKYRNSTLGNVKGERGKILLLIRLTCFEILYKM